MLLDTNALFLPARAGFPLDAEIARLVPSARVVVPVSVLAELDRLVARRARGAPAARALAERYPTTAARDEGDAAIVDLAVRRRAIVVTADRALQERLARRGVAVLVPRDRHRLELRRGERDAGGEDARHLRRAASRRDTSLGNG